MGASVLISLARLDPATSRAAWHLLTILAIVNVIIILIWRVNRTNAIIRALAFVLASTAAISGFILLFLG